MEHFAKLECTVDSTNPEANLELEIWVDTDKIFDSVIKESQLVEYKLNDDDAEHELKFVLKNKTDAATTVDESGNIVKDSLIQIRNLKFDDIELGHLVTELTEYRHNFNNHKEAVVEKFYGDMGCNGTVSLKFTTPIYLWLLENM